MALEYARLDLLREVPTDKDGVTAQTLVINRPTAKVMLEVLDSKVNSAQLEAFVKGSCRALNGTGEVYPIKPGDLDASDAAELLAMLVEIFKQADEVGEIALGETGDGINAPLVYTLQHPIKLTPEPDGDTVRQISFQARRIGDLSDFLDSRGMKSEFMGFMRSFGTLVGYDKPITEAFVNALDFTDFLVIRGVILGKLAGSRRRWKMTST